VAADVAADVGADAAEVDKTTAAKVPNLAKATSAAEGATDRSMINAAQRGP
jgi:hypothetical protein